MNFRDRLRELIEFSGMLDKEVAEKVGISKNAIDSYVGSRACMPSLEVGVRLAKVLGVSVEYLVTGIDSTKETEVENKHLRNLMHYFSVLSDRDKKLLLNLAEDMSKTS